MGAVIERVAVSLSDVWLLANFLIIAALIYLVVQGFATRKALKEIVATLGVHNSGCSTRAKAIREHFDKQAKLNRQDDEEDDR